MSPGRVLSFSLFRYSPPLPHYLPALLYSSCFLFSYLLFFMPSLLLSPGFTPPFTSRLSTPSYLILTGCVSSLFPSLPFLSSSYSFLPSPYSFRNHTTNTILSHDNQHWAAKKKHTPADCYTNLRHNVLPTLENTIVHKTQRHTYPSHRPYTADPINSLLDHPPPDAQSAKTNTAKTF